MKTTIKFFLWFVLAMLYALAPAAFGAACFSVSPASGGNWSTASNWNCGGTARVPTTTDTVEITSGSPISLNQNTTVQNITVDTGAVFTTDNNSRVLTLTAGTAFTIAGTGTFTPGNSTVAITADANTTLTSGAITFNNLQLIPTISGNRTYTFGSGAITVNGNFDVNPTKTANPSRSLTVNMGAAISIAGTTTITATGGRATATMSTTTSNYALTTGNLNIATGGTLTANGSTITLKGSSGPLLTRAGTFTQGTSTVVMNSASSVTLTSGTVTFYKLTINMSGQTGTLGAATTVSNALAINAGTLSDGGNQITGNNGGPLTMAAGTGLLLGSTSTATTFPTTFTATTLDSTSTVTYNSNAAQTVLSTLGYGNLVLASTAAVTKTAGGALTVNGNLTINANNTFASGSSVHSLKGNFVNNGGFTTATGGTITFNGTSAQTISGSTNTSFNNVTINNASGVALSSNSPTIGGTLTLTAGAFSVGANTLTLNGPAIAGTPTNLSTTSSSNLVFGGSSAGVSVPAGLTVNNLTISNTSAVSQGGDLTVAGTLTLSGGTFSVGANTLTLNGSAIAGAASNLSTTSSSSLAFGGNATGISVPSSISALNNLTINNANGVSLGASLTLGGTLTLNSGTLTVGASTLTLNGPAIAGTATNLITSSGSSLAFGGSSTGVGIPSSVTALKNLTINNANGVTANSYITVGGLLALTNGALTTGANKIAVSGNCSSSSSMTRGTGYVIGYLKLTFPSGSTTTCTYHVGTGTSYAPIGVTMVTPSIIGGGTLTGTTVGAEHPQIASSSIDPTKDVNRYWSLWASGDSINFTSYAVTLNFATGDPDAIATPTSFVVGKYVGSAWSSPTPVTAGSTSTSISSQTAALTSTTDFAAGETAFVCSTPSDLPSGMSCVCDSFARAVLNPSTIFDGDWVVSDSGTTQFTPKIVNTGYFRLTSNQTNVATRATMPGTFPAAGNMVTVEFKHYAYNTTTTGHATGADGMALTLSDSSITPVPGAYGGSLGYAQKTGIPGFAGGWIGVGIDEYGNYAIEGGEGRFGGVGTSLVPNSITIRGSGSGSAYQNNYPYLATTGTLSTAVSDPSSTNPSRGHAYRIVVDARCYQRDTNANGLVCNNASLAKKTQVTVYRNTSGAATFNSSNKVIDFDAYSTNAAQSAVPSNWKLSFTAGTGSVTNIHEISGIRICAATIVPPSGFRIQIDNSSPSTCAKAGGTPAAPIVTITAVDANGNATTSYTGTVTLSTKLQNGSSTAAVWTNKSGNGTFNSSTNQYQFVAADNGTAQFYLTDASTQDVYVTVSDGSLSSSASSPVQFSGGLFEVSSPDNLGTSVVAGRPHEFTVKRTTCSGGVSSTDASYVGTKALDAWYNVDSDHPSGADAPKICQAVNGHCIPSFGTCTTLAIAAPVLSATNNNLSLDFSSGVAKYCLVTSDVGKYSLSIRDDSNVSSPVVGSTALLTPRPLALAVTGIKQVGGAATVNPSGTATSGNKFIAAGDTFQATVGAYLWSSAADSFNVSQNQNVTGGDGLLDSGVTLSTLTAGGLARSFSWPVTLSTVSGGFTPTIGTDGTLMNGTIGAASFSSGSATDSLLTYSEVGSFTLSAKATGFLYSSGVDVDSGVFDSTGARNAVVGRFFPDHFTLTSNSVTAACTGSGINPFTYLGQPFSYKFDLEARTKNVAGSETKTTKYDSSVNTYATASPIVVAENNNDGTDRASNTNMNLTQPATPATWSLGTYSYSTSAASFTRPSTPSGTFELMQLGVKVTGDSDGAVLGGRDMDAASTGDCAGSGTCTAAKIGGGTSIHRFGRLRLDNAVGSELLGLPIPTRTEYWNGSVFITNTDDKCTSIPSSSVSLQNYQPGITSSNMPPNNFSLTGTVNGGKLDTFKLKKPVSTPSGKGSVDVCIRLGTSTTCNASSSANMPWLQGKWNPGSSTYSDDPVSRATFGIYKGGPIIYLRELH